MRRPRPALLGAVLLMSLLACGPGAEDVAEARARYAAALDGFVVLQEPVPGTDPSAAPKLEQDVELTLIVRRERRDPSEEAGDGLRGVTVDVDQTDAAGASRRHWRLWIETAGLAPGGEQRAEKVLEDVDFTPGDRFRVEVRRRVPAAERADYAEWNAE